MESLASISECGGFVAVARGHDFHVHSLRPTPDSSFLSPIHHDLSRIFYKHRKLENWSSYNPRINVSIIQWEHVNETVSTKVAVCATDGALNLVLIFDFAEEYPIVIEADSFGVERIQWLPFYSKESAYSNCTLLAVSDKLGLELRVYSLSHTHVLLSVPKPLLNEVLILPDDSGVFSVVVYPYHEKNISQMSIRNDPTALWPTILHFHTDGVSCSLLASLKLDFDPSPRAQFSWADSGKWLLYFDAHYSLNSHKLSVFNLLGIHDKALDDITSHVAQPTRILNYDPESRDARIAGLSPKAIWGHVDTIDYIIVIPTKSVHTLGLRVSDISDMFKSDMHELDLEAGQIWSQIPYSSSNLYRRVKTLPGKHIFNWDKTFSFGSYHLISTETCVVILKARFKNVLRFEILATILTNSQLLEAKQLSNGSFVLVFTDHIVLHTPSGMDVIASSDTTFTQVKLFEEDGELKIAFLERRASGYAWEQVDRKVPKNGSTVFNSIPTTTDNHEEDKIADFRKPMRLGYRGTGLLADSSGLGEEITDTFRAKKRKV